MWTDDGRGTRGVRLRMGAFLIYPLVLPSLLLLFLTSHMLPPRLHLISCSAPSHTALSLSSLLLLPPAMPAALRLPHFCLSPLCFVSSPVLRVSSSSLASPLFSSLSPFHFSLPHASPYLHILRSFHLTPLPFSSPYRLRFLLLSSLRFLLFLLTAL